MVIVHSVGIETRHMAKLHAPDIHVVTFYHSESRI